MISARKLIEEISLNLAYRRYIGYDLNEATSNHSIFSKERVRFGKKLFLDIFKDILKTTASFNLLLKDILLTYHLRSTLKKLNENEKK